MSDLILDFHVWRPPVTPIPDFGFVDRHVDRWTRSGVPTLNPAPRDKADLGCSCEGMPWRLDRDILSDYPLNDWHISVRFGDHQKRLARLVATIDNRQYRVDSDSIVEILPGRFGYVIKHMSPNHLYVRNDFGRRSCPTCKLPKVQTIAGRCTVESDPETIVR